MNRGKPNIEYSLDADHYFEPITGSQIALVYGVSNPIQEAPSQEEITLRQIDSNIPKTHNIIRGDHRHFSQGFSNLSHMAQLKSRIDQSASTNKSKKDQQLGISKQEIVIQQLQEDHQWQDQQQIVTAHSLAHSTPIPNSQLDGQQNNTLEMLDFSRMDYINKQNQIMPQPQIQIMNSPKLQLNLSPRIQISSEITNTPSKQLQQQQQQQQQQQDKLELQQQQLHLEKVTSPESNISIIPHNHPISVEHKSPPKQPGSLEMLCPFCAQNITTNITFQPTCKTHAIAVGLGLVGFLCGLCLIPYYFPERFQTAQHSCPICKKQIAIKDI